MNTAKTLEIAKEFEKFAKADLEAKAADDSQDAKSKKWIQKGVKHPGRFKGWSLAKMKSRYNALKKKKDKSKSETSEMRALALGIRFKGGDVPGGKKHKGL